MSRRKNGTNKLKLEKLNEINVIDKKLKRRKVKNNEDEYNRLMSQYERNLELLNKRRIVYRRDPITDIPDIENAM